MKELAKKRKEIGIVIAVTIIGFILISMALPGKFTEVCTGSCGASSENSISDCVCTIQPVQEPIMGYFIIRTALPILIGTGSYYIRNRPNLKEEGVVLLISITTYVLTDLAMPFLGING